MAISIPEHEIPAFKRLLDFPEKAFGSLLEEFKASDPRLGYNSYADAIAKRLPDCDELTVKSIIATIFSILRIKEKTGTSTSDIVEQVVQAVSESDGNLRSRSAQLQERIVKALDSSESLTITAKASNVMTEHDQVFIKASFMSDIRPIFTDTLKTPPAAVIVHNLVIGVNKNGEHAEIFVALDNNDLKHLKSVIERAEKKTESLKSILAQSNIKHLDPSS